VAQIALDGSGIDAIICQFEAAAMPQHVRMDFQIEACRASGTFHHGLKAPRRKTACRKSGLSV